ncbi:TPA: hypothetical protein N4790_004578 [Shigella sonnei]|nr:hypothetical protein [Shigella sonnei]
MEIWGWVKPNRERGPYLAEALENPHQNVCFSLRAIVREGYVGGVKTRRLDRLVTFDWVIEDGLQICNKYSAIQRGSKVAQESTRVLLDRRVSLQALEDILRNPNTTSTIATESRRGEVRALAQEYLAIANKKTNLRVMGLGNGKW